ncbi:MAG: GTPase [Lachnospiraceae bacterium]|nr:GTPase [Lachnospiraceae bacterium]MEE0919165.1 GTP-binding protein [Lachnospiraceae bacterium]
MIKTYFINGFLESGKTTFIKNLFEQDYFKTGERTLLLLCEEGEEEYDEVILKKDNIFVAEIEDEENFTPEYITSIEKEIKPTRVIIEFNGMWNRKEIDFPWYWDKPVEIALFDASIFEMYSKNMKSMVSEQVRNAALVIFNRCDSLISKLPGYRRNVMAVNTGIKVSFEDKNGEIKSRFDEDLPYDISKQKINITNKSYATFYIDAMENIDRYIGKNVSLTAMVMKKSEDNSNTLVIGRFVMTCCADDMSVFGFICDFDSETDLDLDDWIFVNAIVEKEYAEKYDTWYPVLHIASYNKCEAPQNEVIEDL